MLKLMLITGDPGLAAFAASHGVQRIFVDLEIHGKQERQGHRDTLISRHTMADVAAVRTAIPGHELLVRVNPEYEGSEAEIDQAIKTGADLVMLPMFTTMEEIRRVTAIIAGRCRFVPLVETPRAVELVQELVHEPGVDELYIGLNDLHLALGMDFMFELLVDGTVERLATTCRSAAMPFGFGGIARMEEGMLPGELVLAEHLRLGSSAVILSRSFHRASTTLDEIHANLDFGHEVTRLRQHGERLSHRDAGGIASDHAMLLSSIAAIITQIHSRRDE